MYMYIVYWVEDAFLGVLLNFWPKLIYPLVGHHFGAVPDFSSSVDTCLNIIDEK